MLATIHAAATNFGVIGETLASPWRRRQWWLIPAVAVLALYLLPRQLFLTVSAISHGVVTFRQRLEEKRRRRRIEEEGRSMYPLW